MGDMKVDERFMESWQYNGDGDRSKELQGFVSWMHHEKHYIKATIEATLSGLKYWFMSQNVSVEVFDCPQLKRVKLGCGYIMPVRGVM